jgi:hypothetical protein
MFKYRKAMLFVNRAVYIMSAAMLVVGLILTVLPAHPVAAVADTCVCHHPPANNSVVCSDNSGVINGHIGHGDYIVTTQAEIDFCLNGNDTPPVLGCMNPAATNYNPSATLDDGSCVLPDPVCEDPNATNVGGALPCTYPDPVCEDPNATNVGGALPCVYPDPVCEDPNATNFGGTLPCTYPSLICEDPNATNTGGPLPCTYPEPTCQDPNASNFGGALPCTYPEPTCQDPSATNIGGALPCIYPLLIPETGGLLIPVTGADLTQPISGWFFGGFGMFGFGMILSGLRKMFNL